MYRICTVQIQSRKYVLDHADKAAFTRQRELDRTDEEYMRPEDLPVDHEVTIDDLCTIMNSRCASFTGYVLARIISDVQRLPPQKTSLLNPGISRDSRHKRRETGGRRAKFRKKRKFEMGRPAANTKLGHKRVHPVRCRGGNMKYRALRLDTGNFSWGTEGERWLL